MVPIASVVMMTCRSCGVSGPTRDDGGLISVRWTGDGRAVGLQQRDQRLADLELGDRGRDVDRRIDAEGLRRRLDRLLVARGEGVELVLDAVAELAATLSGMSIGFCVTK